MSITYVGSTLSAFAGAPATEDMSGYTALTLVEVGKILTIGEIGDTSEDVSFDLLKPGRKSHVNGVKDLGEIAVTVEVDNTDTGQTLIRDNANNNTTISFGVTDADGEDVYFQGVIANYRDNERTPNSFKGASFTIRGQTGTVRVTT